MIDAADADVAFCQQRAAGKASMTLAQRAWRAGTLVAAGEIRIGCVDAGTFRPRRIPTELMTPLA